MNRYWIDIEMLMILIIDIEMLMIKIVAWISIERTCAVNNLVIVKEVGIQNKLEYLNGI